MSSRAAAGRKRLQNGAPPPPKQQSKPSRFARAFSRNTRPTEELPPSSPTQTPFRHPHAPLSNPSPSTPNVLLYSPKSKTLKPYVPSANGSLTFANSCHTPPLTGAENRASSRLDGQTDIYYPPQRPFAHRSFDQPGDYTTQSNRGTSSPALTATSLSIANFPLNPPSLHDFRSDDHLRHSYLSNTLTIPNDASVDDTNALQLTSANRQAVFYPSPPRSPANAHILQQLDSPSVSVISLDAQNSRVGSSSEPSLLEATTIPTTAISTASATTTNTRRLSRPMTSSSTSSAANKDPDGFYFPSSRSRAVPTKKTSSNTPNALSFSFKKKSSAFGQGKSPPPTSRSDSSLGSVKDKMTPSFDRARSQGSMRDQPFNRHLASSSPALSSSSGSFGTPQGQFVFPSSRSRAHPKAGKSTAAGAELDQDWRKPKDKFIGLTFKKKQRTKKGKKGNNEDDAASLRPASVREELFSNGGKTGSSVQDEFKQGCSTDPITRAPHPRTRKVSTKDYDVRPESAVLDEEDSSRLPYLATPTPEPVLRHRPISKVGSYPLDPYDSTLIENDRLTYELLKRTNESKQPCFFHYGTDPPLTILELGCGQGNWMLDAALEWKGYGTKVTGVDTVDISKSLRARAVKLGVSENIEFVRTNFIQRQLPFPDESFDLVRMSCLALAVPYEKWDYIFREACRLLTPGGRLELIDDHLFFAYGMSSIPTSASPPSNRSLSSGSPPMVLPNVSASLLQVTPRRHVNEGSEDAELYSMYQDDYSESATLLESPTSIHQRNTLPATQAADALPSAEPALRQASTQTSTDSDDVAWSEAVASSREMEMLFEHMMNMKYGIHLCPSEFILQMMQEVFGHAREAETLHFTLASPIESGSHEDVNPLLQAPGLVLWPSTLVKMSHGEVEAHTLKHNKVLLSCKAALAEYASELADGEDIEEEAMMEALWDYESFLTDRFAPPPGVNVDIPAPSSRSASPGPQTTAYPPDSSPSSPTSIPSLSDDGQRAMWEYKTELQNHFAWPPNSGLLDSAKSAGIKEVPNSASTVTQPTSSTSTQLPPFTTTPPSPVAGNITLPGYSRFEPTHVRTFHIYHAIKLDQSVFTTEM